MQLCKLCKHASELEWSGGRKAWKWAEVGREGEGRPYHDITPLLCHYVLEQHSFSMMSEVARGGWSGGGGGVQCRWDKVVLDLNTICNEAWPRWH